MTQSQQPGREDVPDRLLQVREPKQVGNRRTIEPDALGDLATERERSVLAGKGKTGDARVYRAVFHKL